MLCALRRSEASNFTASLRELEKVRIAYLLQVDPSAGPPAASRAVSPAHRWCSPNELAELCLTAASWLLLQCGWYWGPMNWEDAEMKLKGKPDGSFLVRDSSDPRYILSLSFRSQGVTHHTRMEHYRGERPPVCPHAGPTCASAALISSRRGNEA